MQVKPGAIVFAPKAAQWVAIGLGANLGDAAGTLREVITQLAQLPRTTLVAQSSLYLSAPVDATGPDFINAVVLLRTHLSPAALLLVLQQLEQQHLRIRLERNAPRTLDLDVLLYGKLRLDTPALQVPHPRMWQRAFVLQPLLEVAQTAGLKVPANVQALADACADQPIHKL